MINRNFPKSKERWLVLLDRAMVPAIVALVAVLSFGLGRLSALEGQKAGLVIHPPSQAASAGFAAVQDLGSVAAPAPWLTAEETPAKNPYADGNPNGPHNFVASKNGAKYYPADCGGAKRISEKNKIWFATQEEARLAGYAPAANCKY